MKYILTRSPGEPLHSDLSHNVKNIFADAKAQFSVVIPVFFALSPYLLHKRPRTVAHVMREA